MSGAARGRAGRFPGFDVLDQAGHWDPVTAGTVLARVQEPAPVRFFTGAEQSCARALLDLLTGQDERDGARAVPVLEMVDARLAAGQTDGWRYDGMPGDGQAWRSTLALLDTDARQLCAAAFADAPPADRARLVQAVQDLGSGKRNESAWLLPDDGTRNGPLRGVPRGSTRATSPPGPRTAWAPTGR